MLFQCGADAAQLGQGKAEAAFLLSLFPRLFLPVEVKLRLFIISGGGDVIGARAQMAMPSRTLCGSPSRTEPSMNAPGSPSSPLHTTYFGKTS